MANQYGKYGKHHEAKKGWISAEDTELPSYFDTPDFHRLCEKVVKLVRRAKREKTPATYRYFSERVNSDQRQWLAEAVDFNKRKGLIQAQGSLLITVFVAGGKELKPEKRAYDPSMLFNAPKSHKDAPFADIGVLQR